MLSLTKPVGATMLNLFSYRVIQKIEQESLSISQKYSLFYGHKSLFRQGLYRLLYVAS